MKKYDYCLMNPPYSRGKDLLYPKFFKKALEVADEVHCIMPLNMESNSTMIGDLNTLVQRHKLQEPEYCGDHFPSIGLSNIHYVRASRHQNNPVPSKVNVLDNVPELLPERDRLNPILGGLGIDTIPEVSRGVDVISKVFRGNKIITKRISKDEAHKSRKWSSAKWLVFGSRVVGFSGRMNVAVFKNDPQVTWSGWTVAFECDTKRDAKALLEWLESDIIVEQMRLMLEAKKTYTASLDMIRRLPNVG